MKNSVILVTGGTSGIGKKAALLFAQHGAKIVIAGRNDKAGKALVDEIQTIGSQAVFVAADIRDAQSVKSLIDKSVNHFGSLNCAVNCAGIEGKLALLGDAAEEDWDAVMDTNLKGVWLCMKYELVTMIKNGGGSIVNVSSNLTQVNLPTTAIYTASKAGVEAMSRIAAKEYGKYGIRVNTILPGAVDTPMLRRGHSEEEVNQLTKENPLGEIALPEDIAQSIFWLCSSSSRHINGASITIDGGVS